jgi:hypothetical protein
MPDAPKHLTEEQRTELYLAFTAALQAGLLPVLAPYEVDGELCLGCAYWQLVRALMVALVYFAKPILSDDETMAEFLVDIVSQIQEPNVRARANEPAVH